jgi:hypothetical protein
MFLALLLAVNNGENKISTDYYNMFTMTVSGRMSETNKIISNPFLTCVFVTNIKKLCLD